MAVGHLESTAASKGQKGARPQHVLLVWPINTVDLEAPGRSRWDLQCFQVTVKFYFSIFVCFTFFLAFVLVPKTAGCVIALFTIFTELLRFYRLITVICDLVTSSWLHVFTFLSVNGSSACKSLFPVLRGLLLLWTDISRRK